MKINDFKLEVYFGKHEFSAPFLLTQSDCESMSVEELLALETDSKAQFLNTWLGYTEVPGDPELREQIANLYTNMESDDVLVHHGAQEPIYNFMQVYLEKDDHIICQYPIYQSLFEVASSIGCTVSKWMLTYFDTGWHMDVEALEQLITPKTKLIVLNSPNNPTGYTFTIEEMKRITEIAKKYDIAIFADEVYKGIELDGVKRPWFADLYDNAFSLGVMSKAYGLAGLRIGWIASKNNAVINDLIKMKHYTSICSSAPSEKLSIIALKHSDELLNRNKQIIEDNLIIASAFFKQYDNIFEFYKPMAGPVAFLKLKDHINVETFCTKLIEEQGVLLLPESIYDFEGNFFRIGFGRRDFAKSLNELGKFLERSDNF